MSEYTIKPLSTVTWDAFARLCEKHNGMGFGQCWCTWFHPRRKDVGLDADVEAGRPYKEFLVREGRSHAALVFDGGVVEAYPQDTTGKKFSASLLYSATRKGKNHCVMRKIVPAK